MRAGSLPRARPCPTDGRFDTVAARTNLGPWVIMLEQGMAESRRTPPFSPPCRLSTPGRIPMYFAVTKAYALQGDA
jgi:hypothetical protein